MTWDANWGLNLEQEGTQTNSKGLLVNPKDESLALCLETSTANSS